MIRIAATADLHSGDKPRKEVAEACAEAAALADVLLLCGDLTRRGRASQAQTLLAELEEVKVPIVAVLGNHDFHSGEQEAIAATLREAGITVLDGDFATRTVDGARVSICGAKGFCGGFGIRALPDFGEPSMRRLYAEMIEEGVKLEAALRSADGDIKVAVTHYAPISATLQGEDQQIWPFLGSSRLAEAIDAGGADVAFHGHSHYGVDRGTTPEGVPVHNVSMPVIKGCCRLFELEG